MSVAGVLIRGDGVAARCCAHLLSRAGIAVSVQATDRPRLPAIMLGEPAQALIREVFNRDGLFRDLPQIRKRVVAWGSAEPVELEHSAVVISEEQLLESIRVDSLAFKRVETLPNGPGAARVRRRQAGRPIARIFAAPPLPVASEAHRFGSRMAAAAPVTLKATATAATCWIESLEQGWLFLIASAPGAGWLLSVGLHPGEMLSQSRLIREQIAECRPTAAEFAASPRIMAPSGGAGWIACGTAALAFDPLCGDGTANAVREAILASAVIAAAARGDDPVPLLAHYEARLIAGFRRHLAHCLQYYASGFGGPWWEAEAQATAVGLEWCERRLSSHTNFRYRLNGFELQAIG